MVTPTVCELVTSLLWQNLGVNLNLSERRLVALQPQLLQPSRDVHGAPRRAIKSATPTLSEQLTEAGIIEPASGSDFYTFRLD
jgi:hypothetical protein